MQTIVATPTDTLRSEMRRVAHGRTVPRLWHQLRQEWQCATDRAVARTVRKLDHPGVHDDFRMAASERG